MRILLLSTALLATTIMGAPATPSFAAGTPGANAWEIGPVIRSKNYSVGMPLHPSAGPSGWYIDFPNPDVRAGHVHYITFDHGSLAGKSKIVLRYRVDAGPGVRFVPRESPELPATISLSFQRRGDNWSGRGRYASYRWYAPAQTIAEIAPGVHEMTVSLAEGWTSVMGATAASDPAGFADAIADTGRLGIVLGSYKARGHGVYSTGPARLIVTSFKVI